MKSHETDLKLQAWLDGEMPAAEAAEFEKTLAGDAEGQALLGELRHTRTAMTGGELPRELPESREFFWSKIKRQIEMEEQIAARAVAPVEKFSLLGWLQKRLLRVSGAVLVSCLVIFLMLSPATVVKEPGHAGKIEIACDSMGAYTYRDQQEQMTVVWLYDRNTDDSEFTDVSHVDKVTPE